MIASALLATASILGGATIAATPKIQGMNFAHALAAGKGYGSVASAASLQELRDLGINAIAITPFGFQKHPSDTDIVWAGHGGPWISETDDALRGVARQAHRLGMAVMMKPHIWLRQPEWPGSIDHPNQREWDAWFGSYREFILHYARLADEIKAEELSAGNELVIASRHEAAWRNIIGEIRRVYHGRLTYGANLDEFSSVKFWDALDFIGVSAYFPLSDARAPDRNALLRGWKPIATRLEELSRRTGRRIVFTELGYRSSDYATARPWEHRGGIVNLELQKDAYEAFFQAIWSQPWFEGVYFWKWESYSNHARSDDSNFFIEHKPAEAVIRRYLARPHN